MTPDATQAAPSRPKWKNASDLPFGSEFSPSQVQLSVLLEFAKKHGGDWKAFEAAVKSRYFAQNPTSDYNKGKLANNTKLGMVAYGIIDRDAKLTEFGEKLYRLRDDSAKLHAELARHILLNLHGMTLVQCVQDIQAAGETVELIKLREWLDARGIHFPRGGKHPSIMRLWLEKAGVFTSGWNVDLARLKDVAGASSEELEILAALSIEQRAYLKTLANMAGPGPFASNDVEKLATATYGVHFNEKALPKQVLYPLEKAGFVTLERGTKQAGRGAKPFLVCPTEKLQKEILTPLLEQLEKQTAPNLRFLLRRSMHEILKGVTDKDKHTRGLALEALAFKLMRLLDMDYVATRLRGSATGGAEVDLVFQSARLVFSRWQVQCKNTPRVSLEDVAKEVGLIHLLKSNVIVVVSTGEIGPAARGYANKVMGDTNLCIILVNGDDLKAIAASPAAIVDVFNREAAHAMRLKKLEI
ncbi:restriction endonuclease [Fontisphaera persica]|uniref:restriction endonuclease n=1 Tax=Fontisphaera persica TaxID=2974023 RepID=UPI0024BF9BA0|nr:restriction endonuclease [Fontisphaera persica]WCJ60310.1 restriction endonuclease [Fontisphaera persica]